MRCPKCGTNISLSTGKWEYATTCVRCGWTRTNRDFERQADVGNEYSLATFSQWLACAVLSVIFIAGPFLMLLRVRPLWASDDFFRKYYWFGWAIYLLFSYICTPKSEADPISLFYGVPFPTGRTYSANCDPWYRFLLYLAVVLVPGKMVLATIFGIPRFLFFRQ